MNKVFKHSISLLLIGILFFPNLAIFLTRDSNLDNTIDLRDAILYTRALADLAEEGENLKIRQAFQSCMDTLQSVAGIHHIIKVPEYQNDSNLPHMYSLTAEFSFNFQWAFLQPVKTTNLSFHTTSLSPPKPPPLIA